MTRLIFDSLLILMLLGILTLPISSIGLLGINNKMPSQETQVLGNQDKRVEVIETVPVKRILTKDLKQTGETTPATKDTPSKKINKR